MGVPDEEEMRFAEEPAKPPAPIVQQSDIDAARTEGRSEKDIGRQILKDSLRVAKEEQFNKAFDKEKEALQKDGQAAEKEAVAAQARAKEMEERAAADLARRTPDERANLARRGIDPTAGPKMARAQADATLKSLQEKSKAEADLMDSKKPQLMEEGRKQAEREAGDELGNVPVKSPEDILAAVQADRQAQFLDSVTPRALREAEVELGGLFSGVLSSVITNMLTKRPDLVRKHMNVQYRPAAEVQAAAAAQQQQREL